MALIAGAGPVSTPVNVARIYAYVVPASYAKAPSDPDLGHGLHVSLVEDIDGMVRNVSDAQVTALHLSAADIRRRALDNLDALLKTGAVHLQVFPAGPMGKPFILAGGHWATASAMLLPGLRKLAVSALHSEELLVSIPHRDALLVFAKGDRAYRDAMRALVRAREPNGPKPLTFELFELTDHGPVSFAEPGH